ncbi:GNAT family N-acetyltransferase [Gorillibacterium massiliense]|uniref:GNAT family N-acetyltransferase n=1 Tax=Gorillibacterium massiliense TaxID=1280390 RepID=UPI0004B715E5|nr:GNAT family N-acetyltransferase [Gorillibacterium massiliense]
MELRKQGIQARKQLTENELKDIKELEERCNREDSITLKLNWDMLEARTTDDTNDFLYYADGKLVGFLGMYKIESTEIELSGMVHPEYRRQGVFRALTDEAVKECRKRKIPKMIYMCQRGSAAGKPFLTQKLGAKFSSAEYWMERQDEDSADTTAQTGQTNRSGVTAGGEEIRLRKASLDDLALLIRLASEGFDMEAEEASEYVKRTLLDTKETYYVVEADGESIGSLRISPYNDGVFIFGFSVLPEFRGRGYGRTALTVVIDLYRAKGIRHFLLEVATDNDRALGLYESVGFRSKNVNDYYTVILSDL